MINLMIFHFWTSFYVNTKHWRQILRECSVADLNPISLIGIRLFEFTYQKYENEYTELKKPNH